VIFCNAEITDSIKVIVENRSIVSSGKLTPFWFQSNQAGQISAQPVNNSLNVGLYKDFSANKKYGLSYGINFLCQAASKNSKAYFHEAFVEGKLFAFNLTIGIRNQRYGNQFDMLSSGGFLFSGNSRPFPMIRFYMPEYTAVPFTKGYIEVKGAFEYASLNDNSWVKKTKFHYKNAFVRVGGKLPVHINFGLHHAVQWGGESPDYGDLGNSFQDFVDVVFINSGKNEGPRNETLNKKGNHILSQNIGLDVSLLNFTLTSYWQQINEDMPVKFITKAPNQSDKLLGFSLSNPQIPIVQNVLFEFFNSTDQSGPYHDMDGVIYGGADKYFTNGIYPQAYTYYSRIIGTPLITSPIMNLNGENMLVNNSVRAYHFGVAGTVKKVSYKILATKSFNYGYSYHSLLDENIENYSFLTETSFPLKLFYDSQLVMALAYDKGKLFGNSFGFQVGFRTSFLLNKKKITY
jgi:hypothetical protein